MSNTSIYLNSTNEFKPTHLYIKQHKITGLKYFGKTVQADPYSYLGSGTYWKRHIKKYGKEHVVTLWCLKFYDREHLEEFALAFSKLNNIVESNSWANLCEEDGLMGGNRGKYANATVKARSLGLPLPTISEKSRLKRSNSMKGRTSKRKGKSGTPHTDEFKEQQRLRKKEYWANNPEAKMQLSERNKQNIDLKGTSYITNGVTSVRIKYLGPLPNGWRYGRTIFS